MRTTQEWIGSQAAGIARIKDARFKAHINRFNVPDETILLERFVLINVSPITGRGTGKGVKPNLLEISTHTVEAT